MAWILDSFGYRKSSTCWIPTASLNFCATHQLTQSGKFKKTLPEASMGVGTGDAAAKSLTSLRGQ